MAPVQPRKRSSLSNRASSSTNKSPASSSIYPQGRSGPQHASSSISTFLSHPHKTSRNSGTEGSIFANTKKDKQIIRSSAFKSRFEKAHVKTTKKRRRPSKKLITTLESLADALPDAGGENAISESRNGEIMAEVDRAEVRGGLGAMTKIRQRSLKSRPGAMKMREALEKRERERFERNMATIIGSRLEAERNGTSGMSGANGGGAIRLAKNKVEDAKMDIENHAAGVNDVGDNPRETRQGASTAAARWAALRTFISQTLEQKGDVKTR